MPISSQAAFLYLHRGRTELLQPNRAPRGRKFVQCGGGPWLSKANGLAVRSVICSVCTKKYSRRMEGLIIAVLKSVENHN